MRQPTANFIVSALVAICALFASCSSQGRVKGDVFRDTVFVASTPGDSSIKSLLGINPNTKIEVMNWELILKGPRKNSQNFLLNLTFGEGVPNTTNFVGGGEKLTINGKCVVRKFENENLKGEVYQLTSDKVPNTISMVKLNENLFHLLTPDNRLMVGTAGWSYTLNREEPLTDISNALHSSMSASALPKDRSTQVIFEGRTPYLEIATKLKVTRDPNSPKSKWHVTFYKDPATNAPTIFKINNISVPANSTYRPDIVEGKWAIIRGTTTDPNAIIYQLNPDKPEVSVSFLVGDENVLFFLDKNLRPYVGNKHFSFTLNRIGR